MDPYYCWLDQISGIGRRTKIRLLQAAGERSLFSEAGTGEQDPCSGAERLYRADEAELRFLCGKACRDAAGTEKTVQILRSARKTEPERILEDLQNRGIHFTCLVEDGFPDRLRTIPDPPFGIYSLGEMPFEKETAPAAAVIGARMASGYGREQARRFAFRLASRGISIVSGMARGIDGIAQKAALDAGGRSYAVLGCGVDLCYPDENRALYDRLLQEGGILSEFLPGTPPDGKNFPQRNRIISGLSDLVLVIESRRRSGSQITVDMALEQGREVFALPGRVSDALSDGCNRLIRQGAWIATSPQDVLEYFYGTGMGAAHKTKACRETDEKADEEKESPEETLPEDEEQQGPLPLADRILSLLSLEDGMHLEEILTQLQETDEPGTGTATATGGSSEEPGNGTEAVLPETGSGQDSEHESRKVGLMELNLCLLRMKLDGRVEETMTGYYRRTKP